MAVNIKDIVEKEIARLREAVAREESVLVSLKADLKTREGIHRLLSGGAKKETAAKRPKIAAKRSKSAAKRSAAKKAGTKQAKANAVDWDAVLGSLPATFTVDAAAEASGLRGASRRPLAMAVARWVKLGKITRVEPGTYRKA